MESSHTVFFPTGGFDDSDCLPLGKISRLIHPGTMSNALVTICIQHCWHRVRAEREERKHKMKGRKRDIGRERESIKEKEKQEKIFSETVKKTHILCFSVELATSFHFAEHQT